MSIEFLSMLEGDFDHHASGEGSAGFARVVSI
jgi:hypothetical protein